MSFSAGILLLTTGFFLGTTLTLLKIVRPQSDERENRTK
jgi:hypothetical protein